MAGERRNAIRRFSFTNLGETARRVVSPGTEANEKDINIEGLGNIANNIIGRFFSRSDFTAFMIKRDETMPLPAIFRSGPELARALHATLDPTRITPQQLAKLESINTTYTPEAIRTKLVGLNPLKPETLELFRQARLTLPAGASLVLSDRGVIEIPERAEAKYGDTMYKIRGFGLGEVVGTVCLFFTLILNPDGNIEFSGHVVSYVRIKGNWYMADNEKGFLQKRSNNSPPDWDSIYTHSYPYYVDKIFKFVVNKTIADTLVVDATDNQTGLHSPYQYHMTCGSDSMMSVLMYSDGYRDSFDKLYRSFFTTATIAGLTEGEPIEGLIRTFDATYKPRGRDIVNSRPDLLFTMFNPDRPHVNAKPYPGGVTEADLRNNMFKLFSILIDLKDGHVVRNFEEARAILGASDYATFLYVLIMCIRKHTWEDKPKFTHYKDHVLRNVNGGYRKKTTRKKIEK
jgi:hypothetical protein